MWVDYQVKPLGTKYNLTLEWDLRARDGPLPAVSDIVDVINELTTRHAALRCIIKLVQNKPHVVEYRAGSVDPEIRLVQRNKNTVSQPTVTEILHRPILLDRELPARWVILQDPDTFRVYVVGHHIVVDGQSMSILSQEFLALLESPTASLPPATSFRDMHMMERAWMDTEAYYSAQQTLLNQIKDMNQSRWPEHLLPPQSQLSIDTAYRSIDSWASFRKSELDEWSQIYKTSWFRVATALVSLLVADRTRPPLGKEEVLSVGFGGRPREMTASCVGQFANALPVKMPLWQTLEAGDGTFRSLVSAMGKNLSAVKKAELFPAVELARASRESGDNYQPPKVAVTYSPKLAKAECRLFPVEGPWDLFVCFLEYEEDVKLGVIYDPTLFSSSAIGEMKAQWAHLSALSKIDGVKLREMLPWLPKHISLPKVGPNEASPGNPLMHIHQWFDAHAETTPEAPALSSKEHGTLTYGELYASTEKKAQFLLQLGAKNESRILIHLQRGFHTLEWMLAILKSGAAFVYLDTEAPATQVTAVIENCKPSVIINEETVEAYNLKAFQLKANSDEVRVAKFSTSDCSLAYMIYTSGSTGKPKGVMVEHGNIASFVKAASENYRCGYGSRILQLASFSFDASILEWTTALCTGGCLCFAENPKHLVGDYLADVIDDNRVSFMQITPTALETLPVNRALPSLQLISVGGEAVSRELLARWHDRVDLVNAYGPTEGAVAVSFNKIKRSNAPLADLTTVGRASPGTTICICAEGFGAILGAGRIGEVCFSGKQVARGYSELPEQTSKSFAIHGDTGDRMYRTGDKGQMLPDGSVLIMGRMDRELKVRGFRIAPEEIEGAIFDAQVGVTEASVLTSEDGREMVALVTPESVSTESLLRKLRTILAPYKVPSRIVRAASLPKNTSGKTDHATVRRERTQFLSKSILVTGLSSSEECSSEEHSDSSGSSSYGDDEKAIGKIWATVLGLSDIPAADINFFDIGGHSLLVPKLHESLKTAFPSKSIRLVDLFHQSTIKNQVALFGSSTPKKVKAKKTKKVVMANMELSHQRRSRAATPISSTSSRATSKIPSRHSVTTSGIASRHSNPTTAATSVTGENDMELDGVAIVGLAGRFPGAKNPDEFYKSLMQGYSGIKPATNPERKTLPGNLWVPHAGALDNVEHFDHKFWHLSREEATEMDPQQRLFLEVAYEALTDAGYNMDNSKNSEFGGRAGLFVGCANNSYHLYTESVATHSFLKENRPMIAPSISARTAYHLNIRGPNATIQTNCASSTVALSLAFDSLRLGRCDIAVVGGVSVQLFEGGYVTQEGQIFSSTGVCRPFDAQANGTVPADAVTCVVLKRYSTALLDETPMYARILGTGIGSDGALEKVGYQVPSPRGQAEIIKAAWETAGRAPSRLRYAEIHGSGTPIGDALELEGLALALRELGSSHRFTVGSVKGNIGNAQHASGLVSLIKICKSMQAGTIPCTKGLETPNAMINPALPIDLAMSPTKLSMDDIIAVSASGWGGVDSHVVLGFPQQGLLKESSIIVPEGRFSREALQAPRLKGCAMLMVQSSIMITDKQRFDEATGAFAQAAAKILGTDVESHSNLKDLGLSSVQYVALISTVAETLSGPNIGAIGFVSPVLSPASLAEVFISRVSQQGLHQRSTPLLASLDTDATVLALEHAHVELSEVLINAYTEVVASALEPHIKEVVFVGVSMGGLLAPRLAHEILKAPAVEQVKIVLLDSPPPPAQQAQVPECAKIEAVYIGAEDGQHGSMQSVEQIWTKVLPKMTFHKLRCSHFDIWGESHAKETATIISEFLR
ncbi:amino acid adenylation domain protein [Akanthomyces lecanii RCEF 1005]|uniref:Amino acid adenylation domain protein n=1 Tax=Akanthomyces lecanii RCEF 1005 TaxID=1081108 RepID=A0A168HSZ7_CORDF|nr:amino acid adenylation domain protein [Akanthomyces lecanii RCEF 1005]